MAARPFEQFEFEKVFNGKCVSFRNLTHLAILKGLVVLNERLFTFSLRPEVPNF